jgi:hypothetical protein
MGVSSTLKKETTGSSEKMANIHQNTRRHMQDDSHVHGNRCENFKPHKPRTVSLDVAFITKEGNRNSIQNFLWKTSKEETIR